MLIKKPLTVEASIEIRINIMQQLELISHNLEAHLSKAASIFFIPIYTAYLGVHPIYNSMKKTRPKLLMEILHLRQVI